MFTRMLSRYRIVTFLLFSSAWLGLASQAVADSNRLGGISTRSYVGNSPENYMIAGVFVNGSAKKVVVRASSVDGILNPNLTIKSYPAGTVLFSNTDWVTGISATELSQTENGKWMPAKQTDAALIVTLQPGLYTMEVAPESSPGVGIIEVYELNATAKLGGISTRSYVGTNPSDYMIAGVFVQGDPKKLIVRGSSVDGVLNPKLTIKSYPDGKVLFENTDWVSGVSASELRTLENGKWKPGRESDATLIVTLNPGLYTLEVSPESSPGVGIVEVYEHPLFLGNDTAIPPTPVAQCPATTTTNCPPLNQLPIMSGLKPSIGIGIDSDRNAIKSFKCLDGTIETIDGGKATFNVNAITSYSDVLRESKKSVKGNIGVDFFKVGGGITEGEYFRQTSYDQSFAMKYVVSLGTQKFSINPNNPFSSSVEQYKTNACSLRQYCGDTFVEQTETGAQLYVTMNFHFTSEVYKKEFTANANAGISTTLTGKTCNVCGVATSWSVPISADITASISKLSQSVKQNGTMEVNAIQEGGSVENLASAIGSRFASCSLTNIAACTALMDKAINYAATKFADSVRTTQPKVLSYTPNLMATIPGVPVMPSDVTPAIKEARELVAAEYEKRIADKERMEVLAATYNLNSTHTQQLTDLTQALAKDIESLRGTGEVCFSDLSSCLSKKCDVFNKLTAYNEDVFRVGLEEGIVAHYPFDTDTKDATGNGNDARVMQGKIVATQGKVGTGAYKFDSSNGYPYLAAGPYPNASTPANLDLQTNFSFATWFKTDATPIHSALLHRYSYTTGYLIGINSYGNKLASCQVWYSHSTSGVSAKSSTPVLDGVWHHVACTYDGKNVVIYVDGKQENIAPYSAGSHSLPDEPLLIGWDPADSRCYAQSQDSKCYKPGNRHFTGELDDLRIYNRALTAAEVLQLSQMK